MAGIIQDITDPQQGYDFYGSPVTGVNKLVTTFTVYATSDIIGQDQFTSEGPDVIQDEIG